MNSEARPYVIAIVVTHHPDLKLLDLQLSFLIPQVREILIVDNASKCDVAHWVEQRGFRFTNVIHLTENLGIAAAHNLGIRWARDQGADFVLLMDQDSIPAPDMVGRLVSAISHLKSPAAVGPRYSVDWQNKPCPFIRIEGLRVIKSFCVDGQSAIPVDFLISSGCLIPISVLDQVGEMREDLFMDYVDIEWCLRARRLGFQSYGVCSAHMKHCLGDSIIRFCNRNIRQHSPLRHFYQFRNAIFLYKQSWVPLNWKIVDGCRLFLRYIFYSLFAKQRNLHFKMMTLGLWFGFLGKSGKLRNLSKYGVKTA